MSPRATWDRTTTWPLFLLAWLSFVPFIGFLTGSVAAAWGLTSERPRALRAAAIGAGGAMLNVIGLVVIAMMMDKNTGPLREAKRAIIESDLGNIVTALEEYRATEPTYPETLVALQRKRGMLRPLGLIDQGTGLFATRTYEYVVAADGQSYDLFSAGRDGEPGTPDDVRPVLPDSILAKAGYRPFR